MRAGIDGPSRMICSCLPLYNLKIAFPSYLIDSEQILLALCRLLHLIFRGGLGDSEKLCLAAQDKPGQQPSSSCWRLIKVPRNRFWIRDKHTLALPTWAQTVLLFRFGGCYFSGDSDLPLSLSWDDSLCFLLWKLDVLLSSWGNLSSNLNV